MSFPCSSTQKSPQTLNLTTQLMQRQHGRIQVDPLELKGLKVEGNIINKKFRETTFNGHQYLLEHFERKGNLLVSHDAGEIKLWDWKSQKCIWTLPIEQRVREKTRLFFADNRLVFSSTSESLYQGLYRNKVHIIDLQSGTEICTIEDFGKSFHKVCVIGKQIFASLRKKSEIGVWDLDGKFIEKLQRLECSDIANFEKYLIIVNISKHVIDIYDTILEQSRTVELPNPTHRISYAYIYMGCIYCVQTSLVDESSCNYFVIDIPRGTLVSQYIGNNDTGLIRDTQYKNFTKKITANDRWVVVANSLGEIYVSNQRHNKQAMRERNKKDSIPLVKEEQFLLGKHKVAVDHLALEENGDLLVSGSGKTSDHPAELKFWNLKKKEQIGNEISLPSIFQISMVSEPTELKLFIASHKSLKILDLLPTQAKGKVINIDHFVAAAPPLDHEESSLATDEEAGYFSS